MAVSMRSARRDRREYPQHLRVFEAMDVELLPVAAQLGEFTFDELAQRVQSPKARAMAPRWLASAEWRDLIERRDQTVSSPRTYAMTRDGRTAARAAA